MVKAFRYILLFLFCLLIEVNAQEKKQIEQKKAELSGIKKEIAELEAQINSRTQKEKESYATVENYSRQNFLLNKLINKLRTEEKVKEDEIAVSTGEIKKLEKEIKQLKENYSKYVLSIYKNGKGSELAGLFDSKSLEQAMLRYKYLQKFSESREKDLKDLKQNKEKLITVKTKLEAERKEKEQLAGQKETEEKQLEVKLTEGKKILSKIRTDKAELRKDLDAKRSAEVKIKNLVSRLIEEAERKRKEEAARLAKLEKEKAERTKAAVRTKTTAKSAKPEEVVTKKTVTSEEYDVDLSTSSFSSFAALKGHMNWPVSGRITKKYGENRNSKLNTVTLNYGVDIQASSDLSVKSVADGVVSAIDWIPGYGSIIIVTHKGDYRTVYSHLSEIHVKEGDKVKMGTVLAKVGESVDGSILHFEIWSSRSNQNPEAWLSGR
jgi:septal ring factor EnvC (AmiA/AmiB activator)